jgi:hypothetical protein
MDGTTKVLVVLLVTWLVTFPLACLAHELGHAIAVWRRTGRRALVVVGRDEPLLRLHLRFCELHFHPFVEQTWCWFDPKGITVGQLRSIARAGSLGDAVLALCFAVAAYAIGDSGSVLFWIAAAGLVVSGIGSIIELIPTRAHAGAVSDGGQMASLRGRSSDEVV